MASSLRRIVSSLLTGGVVVAGTGIGSTVYFWSQDPLASTGHSLESVSYQTLSNGIMKLLGSRARSRFEEACRNARQANEDFLLSVIKDHSVTAYGKEHNLGTIRSREEFVQRMPLTTYEHYKPYVDRVLAGEDQVMFPDKPRIVGITSGTSGSPAFIPVGSKQRAIFFLEGIALVFDQMSQQIPSISDDITSWPNLQRTCKLMYEPKFRCTPAGVKVGPNSSAPSDNKGLLKVYTTPAPAFGIQSEQSLLYLHCLFALKDRNLGIVESNFAHNVCNFFNCLENNWAEMVESIKLGTLPSHLPIEPEIRENLKVAMKADPARAAELEAVNPPGTENGEWARLVWPHFHTILSVDTGSSAIYGQKLRRWIGNTVQIYSPLYAATEGFMGINLDMKAKCYALHPKAAFYEFIPVESMDEPNPKTKFIEELTPGSAYELVVTNVTGLYRYRIGDVISCVSYHGQSPVIEFGYRKGQFLNAKGEMFSEREFFQALKTAVLSPAFSGYRVTKARFQSFPNLIPGIWPDR